MKLTIHSAIAAFGAKAKEKLSNPAASGQPEDQLRAPFEHLLSDLAELSMLPRPAVTAVGESSVSDLKTRPDYAVTVHNALVGFVELKAPGKGADPRKFKDPHDKAQWDLPMGNPGTGTASESYGRASRDTVRWPSRLPMSTGPASSQYDMGSVPSTGNGSFRTIASSIVRTRSFGNHAQTSKSI